MRVLCVCPGTMLRAARDVAERFSELEVDVAYQDDPIDPNRYDLIVLLKVTNVNLPTDHDAEVVAVPLDGSTGIQRLNTVPSSVVERAAEYLEKGGKENLENMLRFLASEVLGIQTSYDPPEEKPWDGVYHPDLGYAEHASELLGEMDGEPVIGVYTSRESWIWENTEIPDALIRAVEDEGAAAIGVFTKPGRGRPIHELLSEDGDAIVDALLVMKKPSLKRGYERGFESFEKLGVPVLNAVVSWYTDRESWMESERGLSPADVAYGVSLSELQGRIDPVLVGTKCDRGGFEPLPRRCRLAARRAIRWARLRRKDPAERRVAVVLNNGICSGGEAKIGAAMGLDTFESLARLLQRMAEEGYRLDWVPKDGRELEREFFRRKAFNEFKRTHVEDIVASGGVVDLVPLDKYLEWFEELPEELQERMVETWGEPPGDSMVLDDHLIIAGIRTGNVFLAVQPKRGCAGTECNGRVCKILHDPHCPPTHHYYAFYRWIRDEFRADVLLHSGTHGTLEWLPGKSVGLSWECWPEVCLGDLPVVYWYIVSNPSEGVQAKRRGYSTLVDHCPPPMGTTEAGLEELEERLEETLRDPDRKDRGLFEEWEVRSGAFIEKGLHVIGEPAYDPERLSEFLFALCRNRLREMIAGSIGLDLEELTERPEAENDLFGATNAEVLRALDAVIRELCEAAVSEVHHGSDRKG
ncbi:cobaltochelatase subunit CobN [Methanopyrus sp. KOL6]|uniref:cobaltochelatase subunit CobN n=1 Tax=Methanopyrus sp. KOL6 TaxID=1937004 RepID=UPI000B4AA900|nr:cobaltochelatase subunit CobN [Methanopyrus sp. KOL6]